MSNIEDIEIEYNSIFGYWVDKINNTRYCIEISNHWESRMHTNNANISRNQKQQRQRFSKTVSNLSLGSSILLMFRIVICAECGKKQLCCGNVRYNEAVLVCLFCVILPSTSNVNPFFITSHLTNTHTHTHQHRSARMKFNMKQHILHATHISVYYLPLWNVFWFSILLVIPSVWDVGNTQTQPNNIDFVVAKVKQ